MTFHHFIIMILSGVLILSGIVSVNDYKHRLIPNKQLMYALIYLACIYIAMAFYGVPLKLIGKGFLMGIIGAVLGGVILYPGYLMRQVGAGDIKLMMVFGLFMGPRGALLSILIGAMIGGVWALCLAWKHGGLGHLWYNMKFMVKSAYLSGFKEMGWDLRSDGAIAMPYGIALSAGASLIALEQIHLYYTRILEVMGS